MFKCRVCHTDVRPFMTFGQMPIANGFLTEGQFEDEFFYEMEVGVCSACSMFQLAGQPEPQQMFHQSYAFYSSLSAHMQSHFGNFAAYLDEEYLFHRIDPFVVELGSNDGIMLQHIKERAYRHLGVEPSANVADIARSKGIDTLSEFFSLDLALRLGGLHGKADVVTCANVMCHIPDINSVAAGRASLLKPDGVLVFEDPYLGNVIEKISYDQIYDEHVFLFSVRSVGNAFSRHGLELVDVMPQETHGGSMRYVLAPKGSRPIKPSVSEWLQVESRQGLDVQDTYDKFKKDCDVSRMKLKNLLKALKIEGKRIVGYGATSKSTSVLNYCGIGPEDIEYITDTTPLKQGKFSPGAHIPIRGHDAFTGDYPDYALLFAWNHANEIFSKEGNYKRSGGKWILFVPEVKVID